MSENVRLTIQFFKIINNFKIKSKEKFELTRLIMIKNFYYYKNFKFFYN